MRMGEVLFACLLAIVGFVMIVIGQQLVQFLGILVISAGIGGAVAADLRKPRSTTEQTSKH